MPTYEEKKGEREAIGVIRLSRREKKKKNDVGQRNRTFLIFILLNVKMTYRKFGKGV